MRLLMLWALSLCLLTSTHAATYYFSSVSGNDSYSSSQAKNSSTPWKSITKLNAIFSTLKPGDVILFKRGETFYGTIKVTKSGSSSAPITFGAYGSGSKPEITGFVTLNNWVSVGGGKYESKNGSLGSDVNVVSLNGKMQEMGRYPNSNADNGGYLNFESHGHKFIKDNELTSSTNWTGAELVVRTRRFVIDRTKVTKHSSSTINYSPALAYDPEDDFGYFFQDDIRTLDQLGEWYYKPSTKKMTVYFGSNSPSNYSVKASALDRVVDITNKDNIIFDGLAFSGGNKETIHLYSVENVQIKNCDISYSDDYAIFASRTKKFVAQNNTINNTQNTAILLSSGSYAMIKDNKITNTGLLEGMGVNGTNKSVGIFESGSPYATIEGNTIENTGYIGIRFSGNHALIKNNIVSKYNLTKDDGSGIYTNNPAGVTTTGQKIIGNIVMDGIGAGPGTNTGLSNYTDGIYLDDRSTNVEIANNTVVRNTGRGIFIHNSTGINMHDNLSFDNKVQLFFSHDMLVKNNPLRRLTIKNNILIARTAAQGVVFIKTLANDIASFGTIDNNIYSRPLDKDGYFITTNTNTATTTVAQVHNLESWKKAYGKDINSRVPNAYVNPHKLKALKGSNLFSNEGFDANINGLNSYATVSHTRKWDASKLDKGTFFGSLTSSTPSTYTASTSVGSVTAGKKYVVRFTAQSSKNSSMNVYFRKSSSPYTCLSNDGTKNVVDITTGRKEYEFVYQPKVSESNAVLLLEMNGANQSFWLDNLKIYEADADITNPDDYIKFVYNTSSSTSSVSLSGTYVDALGKSYSGSISLAPYASAVLIKTSPASTPPANKAPTVVITSPKINATYTGPATVRLTASVSDADDSVKKVEFYHGSNLITTELIDPYDWQWKNVAPGTYTITAKAYDYNGNVTTSAPVTITVNKSNKPQVVITSPIVGGSYSAPASVRLTATASDPDGSVTKVEFYRGSTLILTEYTAPYDKSWQKVLAGTYTITAKAYDNSGNVTTSAPVTITVRSNSVGFATVERDEKDMNSQASTGGLSVYPNPAVNKIFVAFDVSMNNNKKANLTIRNTTGSVVKSMQVTMSGNGVEVDITSLTPGTYVVTITGNDFTKTQKFLKTYSN